MKGFYFFMLIAFASLLIGCSNEEGLVDQNVTTLESNTSVVSEDSFVSSKDAIGVANAFFNQISSQTTLTTRSSKLEAGVSENFNASDASIEAVKDRDNKPLLYIMNYRSGGFVVVSATKDYYPILAYSDEGSFIMTLGKDMGPVSVWLEETIGMIKSRSKLSEEIKGNIRTAWNQYRNLADVPDNTGIRTRSSGDPYSAMMQRLNELRSDQTLRNNGWLTFVDYPNAGMYFDSYTLSDIYNKAISNGTNPDYAIIGINYDTKITTVGPFILTVWGQNKPYNSQCPDTTKAAGCASVAMAQIVKFYECPFNLTHDNHTMVWSSMVNSGAPTGSSTPYLIAYTRSASMSSYWNNNSYATPGNVVNGWQALSYNVTRKSHNITDVNKEIVVNKRPVMMLGFPGILDPNGHYWICDGNKDYTNKQLFFVEYQIDYGNGNYIYNNFGYSSATYPAVIQLPGTAYYHMNWGWANSSSVTQNGWFFPNYSDGNDHYRENFYVHP